MIRSEKGPINDMIQVSRELNPNISVDCVVFGLRRNSLKVILVERSFEVLDGEGEKVSDYKLPGSLVYNDELLDQAAQRVMRELTGLVNIRLERYDILDSLERVHKHLDKIWLESTSGLEINRVVSVAFFGLVNLESDNKYVIDKSARWMDLEETKHLPFDHSEIIQRALLAVQESIRTGDLIFRVLPEKFTIAQLQRAAEVICGVKLDSRNFRKKLKKINFILPLEEKQIKVAHKPARLFGFDQKKYMESKRKKNLF